MRRRKVLILLISILALVTSLLVFQFLESSHTESAVVTETKEVIPQDQEIPVFFDREYKKLSRTSTITGTSVLIDEIEPTLEPGETITLSIDSELQEYVYGVIKNIATQKSYVGGAGVIMDVHTGELLTLVSYSEREPSVNSATNGLFIPGSIIKPFVALAALKEGVIDPEKEILSTGSLRVTDQNGKALFFKDWKAHGYVDMRNAIGVSSNVYFYTIGGGYEDQRGLGIDTIDEYLQMFGIGDITQINVLSERDGELPSPKWKKDVFHDEWRLADTYLASIGQHGYKVTPLQMTRAVAAIATEGEMVVPGITHDNSIVSPKVQLPVKNEYFKVVKEGMEYAVLNGTASGLYMNGVTLGAKTGTAEVDANKTHIHSWIIGYFPKEKPKYAFTFMLDTGPWGEEIGAVSVAHSIFLWMKENRPDYLNSK